MQKSLNQKLYGLVNRAKGKNRRQHERMTEGCCVAVLDGRMVPVENWSLGGMLVQADDRLYKKGQNVELMLRFYTGTRIVNIPAGAIVARKVPSRLGLQFKDLSDHAYTQIKNVLHSYRGAERQLL